MLTVIRHPDDCRLYISFLRWNDPPTALIESTNRWVYIPIDAEEAVRELVGDLPSHPGEYAEYPIDNS